MYCSYVHKNNSYNFDMNSVCLLGWSVARNFSNAKSVLCDPEGRLLESKFYVTQYSGIYENMDAYLYDRKN